MQSLVEKAERFDVQEEDIDNLKNDIEKLREENYYLKNKLDTKRDIIEDMESDLDIYEKKIKDAEKNIELKENELIKKETDLEAFEVFVKRQVEEIDILKDNNQSMIRQISENVIMERKISIQNKLIKELKDKLNCVKDESKINEEKTILENEVDRLASEVRELMYENKDKLSILEKMETENEFLRESLEREKENKHVELFGSDTLLEEFGSEQF